MTDFILHLNAMPNHKRVFGAVNTSQTKRYVWDLAQREAKGKKKKVRKTGRNKLQVITVENKKMQQDSYETK